MQTLFNILQEKATRPTVLYLHGVAHTRGYPHRVDLYKVGHEGNNSRYHFMTIMFWWKDLLDAGFPVLAIDYRWLQKATICNESLTCSSARGFGDSTEVTDIREKTVVEDAHRALRYLTDTIGASSVIVWGHSQVLSRLCHNLSYFVVHLRENSWYILYFVI